MVAILSFFVREDLKYLKSYLDEPFNIRHFLLKAFLSNPIRAGYQS